MTARKALPLQFGSARHRLLKRELVRRFQTCARRQAAGDACKHHRFAFQEIDQIVRCRFTFDVRGQRKNNLGEFFFLDPLEQLFDPQIFRADVIERRDAAA